MTWERIALADLADVQGGIQKQPKRAPLLNAHPFLRVANVTSRGLDLSDVHRIELFGDELQRLRLQRGDLLVVEGNGSASQIGRAAVWDGSIDDCVHQNHLIRVRSRGRLLPRFLGLVWNAPAVRDELTAVSSSTSGLHTLSVAKLKRIVLPIPPLGKQAEIVELLEEHLSRLDAAARDVLYARTRLDALLLATLRLHVAEAKEKAVHFERIGNLAATSLGKMLDAKKATGEPTPYLANINVRWGRFDLDHLKSVPLTADERARLTMEPGDVIVCEGGEPGRCAVWDRENTGIAYQKALHRVRVHDSSRIAPEYLALMIREAIQSGRADQLFTGTTIKHLPQEKLRMVEIPVPDKSVQLATLAEVGVISRAAERLDGVLGAASARGDALRRAVLTSAFEGKLTGRHTDTEVIEELAFA